MTGQTDIRQTADVAVKLIEDAGKDMVLPPARSYFEEMFRLSSEVNGDLSVEFMQGFFSACLLMYTAPGTMKGIADTLPGFKEFLGAATLISAEQYLATIERELK